MPSKPEKMSCPREAALVDRMSQQPVNAKGTGMDPRMEAATDEASLREELAEIMDRSDQLIAEQNRLRVRIDEILRLLRRPGKVSIYDERI